tara:strand:- start:66 stop:317 length:252 start_codon:yes stop_codon:yes gene_type:complete
MKLINYIFIFFIQIYRFIISPLFPNSCKFEPTCSSYCIECLKKYNLIKAIYKSIHRILRCNPWFGYGGYDPVEKEKEVKDATN